MRTSASRALAAAVVIVLLGTAAGIHALRTSGVEPTPRITTAGERTARDESLALGELLRELEARRPLLAPQTISTVEAQLRAINDAIEATQQALEADPRNPHLAAMLEHSRRSREQFLRTTLSLAAEL